MSDLISRQAVIDKIESIDMQVYEGNAAVGRRTLLTKEEVIYAIKELPSIELEREKSKCTKTNCPIQMDYISNDCDIKTCPYRTERKTGEWIYEGKRGRFPACKCSICGHYENADWAILQGANFCPHCGADMRDGQ